MKNQNKNHQLLSALKNISIPIGIFLFSSLLFWGLRLFYWSQNYEKPFSDIADYVRIGMSVYQNWDFTFSPPFWLSYKPPVMPLIIALYFFLRGSFDLDLWPLFQTIIVYLSLLWLVYEVQIVTKRWNFSLFLLLVTALSKGSIFWSFKAATESLSEGFLYLLCAIFLASQRKVSFYVPLVFICVAAFLLKPQFMMAISLTFILYSYLEYKRFLFTSNYFKRMSVFLLIGFLLWLPWGIRTYQLYGHPVLTSTQGPYSFFWELGNFEYRDENGTVKQTHINEIQREAPKVFINDYEAMVYWNKVAQQWIRNNIKSYFLLINNRIQNSVKDKQEYLSTLDRNQLYNNVLDQILISKTNFNVIMSIIGLVMLVLTWPQLLPLLLFPLSFWIMGCLFLGYARILDPCLPLFSFGLIAFLDRIYSFLNKLFLKKEG